MRKIHSNVAMAVVAAGLVASLGALAPTVALADDVQPIDAAVVESNEPDPVSVVDPPAVTAVAPLAAEPVAKIGDATYGSLDDALAAAKDGDTIELLGKASTEKGFGIYGANVTVKGNGHTITASTSPRMARRPPASPSTT